MSRVHASTAPSPILMRAAPLAATAFCFAFGLASLVLVLTPVDGYWPLHAELMLQGRKLYSDLGLHQQPLYFLLSELSVTYLPGTILAQRALPLVLLAVYVCSIHVIARFVAGGRAWFACILQVAVFFTALRAKFYRLDDYHIIPHLGAFLSIYLSLLYLSDRQQLARYVLLQVAIATLVFLTRFNDALAIAASAGFIVLLKQGFSRRLLPLAGAGMGLSVFILLLVLLAIGETPATWLRSTFIEASAAKGGASIATYPYQLVERSIQHVLSWASSRRGTVFLVSTAVLLTIAWRWRRNQALANSIVAAAWLYALVFLTIGLWIEPIYVLIPLVFLGLIGFVTGCATIALLRWRRGEAAQDIRWSLALYPLFFFIFESLSTFGEFYSLIFPLSTTLIIVPAVVLDRLRPAFAGGARLGFTLLCVFLAADGVVYKFRDPYSWWSYRAASFAEHYSFRTDARRGPHFVTRDLTALIDPVCARLERGATLLSTPFSFANYYCGVPIWRGHAQTWYDLSTDAKISRVLSDLRRGPPVYVLHQQQESALLSHENLINQGRPLPYRKLESYIGERVARGEWKVVYESRLYPDSHWRLMRTSGDRAAGS